MRRIQKGREPASLTEHRAATGTDYENYRDKDTLRAHLVKEQRGLWVPGCWYISSDGFREAAEVLEAGSARNVLFCGLGVDCTNFQSYSRQCLYIPLSVTEWENKVRRFPEVRCAYYPVVGFQP